MEAVAHNPSFAKKVGIPSSVGKHFHEADKKMKRKTNFNDGGINVPPTALAGGRAQQMPPSAVPPGAMPMNGMPSRGFPSGGFRPNMGGRDRDERGMGPRPGMNPMQQQGGGQFGGMSALPAMQGTSPGMNPMQQQQAGYKKGGHVKPSELKGKAKETKSIAKEEMKALKRGHAPKKVMEHERAEHKAMGYKHGGKIHPAKVGKDETKQVKYKMKETAGGRKPPHGKHDSEGDTKLKGFGMSHSVHAGHGRKVSKPATPKDEMPTKGFAMKKGGHVKKHTKNMKRGGVSARMKKAPSIGPMMGGLPPALASASPPPPMVGAGGPPPGGMPGMKKGGHVSHHHHHHYAKGGSVRPGIDEKAERGHTKGKMIKMASGGHVGSRADGIASKGRTRCKVY